MADHINKISHENYSPNIAKMCSLFVLLTICLWGCSEQRNTSEGKPAVINKYIKRLKSKGITRDRKFYSFTPLGVIHDSSQARAIVYSFLIPQELSYYNPRYGHMEANIMFSKRIASKGNGGKIAVRSAVYGKAPSRAFLAKQRGYRRELRDSLMEIIRTGDKYGIIEWKSQYKYAKDSPVVIQRTLTPCLYDDSEVIYNIVTGISGLSNSFNSPYFSGTKYHQDLILQAHINTLKKTYYDSVKKAKQRNSQTSKGNTTNPNKQK